MQRYPIAYLRRSSADATDPGDVSREAQETAVRELARRDGYTGEVRTLADWDRSADEAKEGRRAGFLAMLAAIDRGEVDVVYAASLDRLYRSMRTFVRLTDAAKAHDVRIVTLREGVLGGDGSPMAQAFAEITAVFSGLELRTTKARAAGAMAVRRSRGDHIGRVGYGYLLARNDAGAIVAKPDPAHPLDPIVNAVREAGSILAGCKLLMARGVPAPDGGLMWGSTTLRRIIERAAPELIPTAGPSGRRQPSNAVLSQLLVCHCGHVLTPEGRRRYGQPAYRCTRGNRLGREVHGAVWVAESTVLPWVKDEVARLRAPDAVTLAAGNAAVRSALAGRLERAAELYVLGPEKGGWTRERHAAEVAAVTTELDRLGDAEAVVAVPTIDWTWEPRSVNVVLRAILVRVDLDSDLRPVSALWTMPEWRAD
jgi:DNA invertase Pin-like site-specific DNA recombinase